MSYLNYNKYQKYNKQAAAVSYDADNDLAPKLVATGKGLIAEEIIRIAEENGIPIRKDKNLMAILSTLEINEIIPVEAYAAMVEILKTIEKYNSTKDK